MIWIRLRKRHTGHRVNAVDKLQFPASGRQFLGNRDPHLSGDDIRLAEAATRQWFRLVARHPGGKMSVPSVAVDQLWQELARHGRDYAAFCDAAFGRPLPHQAALAIGGGTAGTDRHFSVLATLAYAREDEGASPPALPLLFRVDQELRIRNGNRYLADCGGRGECFRAPGLTCLQHLAGPGKALSPAGIRGGWTNSALRNESWYVGGGGFDGGGMPGGGFDGGGGDGGGGD